MNIRTCLMVLATGCVLSACTPKTPVDIAFDSVDKSIIAIEKALPAECKTEAVQAQIYAIKAQNAIAKSVCEADIKQIQIKYNRLWAVIIIILGVFFARFFLQK